METALDVDHQGGEGVVDLVRHPYPTIWSWIQLRRDILGDLGVSQDEVEQNWVDIKVKFLQWIYLSS